MRRPLPAARKRGAVAVIVRADTLLVIRRSKHVPAPLACCFPGGRIEAGETAEQAAVREVQEELGLELLPRRQLWESVTPWGFELTWWLGEVATDAVCTPCSAEVDSYFWMTADAMAELPDLLESNRHFLAALKSGQIDLQLLRND